MFKVKLSLEIWLEADPKENQKVDLEIDRAFRATQLMDVGLALQAGSWEILKVGYQQLIERQETAIRMMEKMGMRREISETNSTTKDSERTTRDEASDFEPDA